MVGVLCNCVGRHKSNVPDDQPGIVPFRMPRFTTVLCKGVCHGGCAGGKGWGAGGMNGWFCEKFTVSTLMDRSNRNKYIFHRFPWWGKIWNTDFQKIRVDILQVVQSAGGDEKKGAKRPPMKNDCEFVWNMCNQSFCADTYQIKTLCQVRSPLQMQERTSKQGVLI